MNLYIIAHKELPHYLASSNWGEPSHFNWTVDLFFAVFGSDRLTIEQYYVRRGTKHPTWLDLYGVREFTPEEYERLIELQCHHSGFEKPIKKAKP